MKRSIILTSLVLISSVSFSQIDEGVGFFFTGSCDNDTCSWAIPGDEGADSLWHFGTPKKLSPYSGSNCWITDSTQAYGDGRDDYFTVALPWSYPENLVFGFWHWYDTDTLQDGGILEVSFDKGSTYENALESLNGLVISGTSPNFYTAADTLYNGMAGFSGTSEGWIYSRIQWVWALPVKDIPDSVLVRFRFVSDSSGNAGNGWVIDDMDIGLVNFPGSIANPEHRVAMRISPNPVQHQMKVNFESKAGRRYQYRIVDLMGQDIQGPKPISNGETVSCEGLASGSYWILLEEDGLLVGRETLLRY